jgi:hypothetical protein
MKFEATPHMHFIHMNRENFDEGSSFPGVQNGMKMN